MIKKICICLTVFVLLFCAASCNNDNPAAQGLFRGIELGDSMEEVQEKETLELVENMEDFLLTYRGSDIIGPYETEVDYMFSDDECFMINIRYNDDLSNMDTVYEEAKQLCIDEFGEDYSEINGLLLWTTDDDSFVSLSMSEDGGHFYIMSIGDDLNSDSELMP